jgi:hypothetical protein
MTTPLAAELAGAARARAALARLDDHLAAFTGWDRETQLAHLRGADAHRDHWMHDDDITGALDGDHAAEHARESLQAQFDLAIAQQRAHRPPATPLADVLADAEAEGMVWAGHVPASYGGSGEPGTDARGLPALMLIFATPDGRRRFLARWRNSWVTTADRSAYLGHWFDWKDVQGYGLSLSAPAPREVTR